MIGVGFKSCTALHLAEYRYSEAADAAYACVVADRWRAGVDELQDVVLDDRISRKSANPRREARPSCNKVTWVTRSAA